MKFGIILDSKQNKGMLTLNSLKFIKILLFVMLFVVAQRYLLAYQKFDFLLYILIAFAFYFLIRYKIVFDSNYIILSDELELMQKKMFLNEIKEVRIDENKIFFIVLPESKEFVFRARRQSEYEDLKNQFYSVGLYKGDIRK